MSVQLQMVTPRTDTLAEHEARIEASGHSFMTQARSFTAIQDDELWKDAGYRSFGGYMLGRWSHFDGGERQVRRIKAATEVVENLGPIGPLPTTESQCRPLVGLKEPDYQRQIWWRVLQRPVDEKGITAKVVTTVRDEFLAELNSSTAEVPDVVGAPFYTVAAWESLPAEERARIIAEGALGSGTTFNRTNENVEWAYWTWNPVTGCDHGCDYCYARDLAQRYYTDLPEGERFAPVLRPRRLHAPRLMSVPDAYDQDDPLTIGEKNVFVCSMADLFGKWVPQDWIDAVFAEVVGSPEWNYLFLTKFPQRLAEQRWPENAWCGTTVDRQTRVGTAERSFRDVTAGVKWLSCEPMLERLTFTSLEMFDWVVIGGSSKSSQTPEFQPPWEWIEHLTNQARAAGCKVYWKPNLKNRPREYPGAESR